LVFPRWFALALKSVITSESTSSEQELRIFFQHERASLARFFTGADMPDTRRITMRQLKDVLRLKLESNHSHQRIAQMLGLSKGVVTKYRQPDL